MPSFDVFQHYVALSQGRSVKVYSFRRVPNATLAATIEAPDGSELRDRPGLAPVLKVPKHGNLFDSWGLTAVEAVEAARDGSYGLSFPAKEVTL